MRWTNRLLILAAAVCGGCIWLAPANAEELPIDRGSFIVAEPPLTQRYGKAVLLTTANLRSAPKDNVYTLATRLVACDRSWSTIPIELTVFLEGEAKAKGPEGVSSEIDKHLKKLTTSVSVGSFSPRDGLSAYAIKDQLDAVTAALSNLCAAPPSRFAAEIPIEATSEDAHFLLLRTVERRGDLVEGWVRSTATRKEKLSPELTKIIKEYRPGSPVESTVVDRTKPHFMSLFAVRCADKSIRLQQQSRYKSDGTMLHQTTFSESVGPFQRVEPETVAETILDVFCRLQ